MPKQVEGKLLNYNTKLRPETKALLDALQKVEGYGSQRELIEALITTYATMKPKAVLDANRLINLMQEVGK